MYRFPILILCTCASGFDITQPLSNAPDLVSFLQNPRSCFTPCGVRVTAGDCKAIQQYEGRVLERLAPVGGWDAGTICDDLAGYTLLIHAHEPGCPSGWRHPADAGAEADGQCVIGFARPSDKTITLATENWEHSAFAHEVVHIADESRPGHCPWVDPHLKLALKELAHYVDPSEAASWCPRDGGYR